MEHLEDRNPSSGSIVVQVLDYFPKGMLALQLSSSTPRNIEDLLLYIFSLGDGLLYCKSMEVDHRDVKVRGGKVTVHDCMLACPDPALHR